MFTQKEMEDKFKKLEAKPGVVNGDTIVELIDQIESLKGLALRLFKGEQTTADISRCINIQDARKRG